jgi:hypothetical protein
VGDDVAIVLTSGRAIPARVFSHVRDARRSPPRCRDDIRQRGVPPLFESHPVAMLIWDPSDDRIVAINDAAVYQYGYWPRRGRAR